MPQIAHHVMDYCTVIIVGMLLSNQHIMFTAIPATCPVLIRPRNAEGSIGFVSSPHSLKWHFQKALASKPVIKITKAVDTVPLGKLSLLVHNFFDTKVIKA